MGESNIAKKLEFFWPAVRRLKCKVYGIEIYLSHSINGLLLIALPLNGSYMCCVGYVYVVSLLGSYGAI